MHIGYIVGIIVAASLIISGGVGIILAKRNGKKSKWAIWAIVIGVIALISAAVNYNLFN